VDTSLGRLHRTPTGTNPPPWWGFSRHSPASDLSAGGCHRSAHVDECVVLPTHEVEKQLERCPSDRRGLPASLLPCCARPEAWSFDRHGRLRLRRIRQEG